METEVSGPLRGPGLGFPPWTFQRPRAASLENRAGPAGPARNGSELALRSLHVHVRLVELAEQLLVAGHILGQRTGHPGGVHVVLQADVLGHDVAAPGAAPHGRRGRHAVGGRTGVAAVVGLAHHDAGHGGAHAQTMDVVVVEGVDAAAVALAAHVEHGLHHGQCVLKLPVVLEQGQQSGQLLAGEEVLLAHVLDAAAGHSDELPVSRDLEPSGLRQLLRADGHGVGQTVPSLVPHDGLQLLSLFLVGQVSALLHQGGYEPVVHVLVDDQVAVAGTAGAEVGALGDPGVHGSLSLTLGGVAGVVDDDSRVAGAGAVGRHTGGVCGLDHGTAAGGDDQVAALHQLLGQGDAGLLDALDDVGGSALTHQGLTDDVDALVGGLLRARMGAADDDVTGLDGIDHLAGRGQAGVGGGHQRRDHAHRLGILHDALLRDLLDHAHAPLTQAVPQDQLQLVPKLFHPSSHTPS